MKTGMIRICKDTLQALKIQSAKEKRPMSHIITEAVKQYLLQKWS